MSGLTYDTGALILAERGDRRVWALHRRALERGAPPTIPAAVLVEGWRGDVQLSRLLQGCLIEPLDAENAKSAGEILGHCDLSVEATDATVVEGALRRMDSVVTSNRSDLQALADGVGRRLAIIAL